MSDKEENVNSLDMLKATLSFTLNGEEKSHSHEIKLPRPANPDGAASMTTQTFVHIEKEIRFAAFYELLSDASSLSKYVLRTFSEQELIDGEDESWANMHEVWTEISNTLTEAKYLLSQARAYKAVEMMLIDDEKVDHRHNEILNIHLNKMNSFDGAVYRLVKIEDLLLLLLFVRFGCSLVETDMDSADWQRKVTWNHVKDGLKKRHPAIVANRFLNQVPSADYVAMTSIFSRFKSPAEVGQITSYRDATTHRIPPSVDYHGFHAVLVFSKSREVSPWVQHRPMLARTRKVDYQFLDLYETAVKVFEHYIKLLNELKALPHLA